MSAGMCSSTCISTANVVASSVAKPTGLGSTSAPAICATSAISGSSVDTTKRSINCDCSAAAMLQSISGRPQKGRMFFPGRPLLPPRAGIAPRTIFYGLDVISRLRRLRGKQMSWCKANSVWQPDQNKVPGSDNIGGNLHAIYNSRGGSQALSLR